MTYDELLAKIHHRKITNQHLVKDLTIQQARDLLAPLLALRAIVELHKPISDNSCSDPGCCGGPYPDLCEMCSEHYPCETIEAIEKEL